MLHTKGSVTPKYRERHLLENQARLACLRCRILNQNSVPQTSKARSTLLGPLANQTFENRKQTS
jgi:hypothetical protein